MRPYFVSPVDLITGGISRRIDSGSHCLKFLISQPPYTIRPTVLSLYDLAGSASVFRGLKVKIDWLYHASIHRKSDNDVLPDQPLR